MFLEGRCEICGCLDHSLPGRVLRVGASRTVIKSTAGKGPGPVGCHKSALGRRLPLGMSTICGAIDCDAWPSAATGNKQGRAKTDIAVISISSPANLQRRTQYIAGNIRAAYD